jgi:hypothetical protein
MQEKDRRALTLPTSWLADRTLRMWGKTLTFSANCEFGAGRWTWLKFISFHMSPGITEGMDGFAPL